MILCDFSMVVISNLMSYMAYNPKDQLNVELIRHITLNALRSYNKQFRAKYGPMVLCCDSRSYWRKDVFPHYKSRRKKAREDSKYDWKFIFNTLALIREEIKQNMPYRVIEVDGAEGDDVIATLARKYCDQQDILILSSDKDFVQLQKYPRIAQYNPNFKRFVKSANPEAFTKEHIIRGDYGDGIPNILSQDDCIAIGKRQKSLNKDKVAEWIASDDWKVFCDSPEMIAAYKRNRHLIDLDYIPHEIRERIEEEYRNAKPASRIVMMNYFIAQKLESLMEVMDEF